jgi:hypothetical protein
MLPDSYFEIVPINFFAIILFYLHNECFKYGVCNYILCKALFTGGITTLAALASVNFPNVGKLCFIDISHK